MSDTVYEEAKVWLEKKYSEACESKDHYEMLLIEWIQEVLWRDNDMRNS